MHGIIPLPLIIDSVMTSGVSSCGVMSGYSLHRLCEGFQYIVVLKLKKCAWLPIYTQLDIMHCYLLQLIPLFYSINYIFLDSICMVTIELIVYSNSQPLLYYHQHNLTSFFSSLYVIKSMLTATTVHISYCGSSQLLHVCLSVNTDIV